jgi:hypothetical protein
MSTWELNLMREALSYEPDATFTIIRYGNQVSLFLKYILLVMKINFITPLVTLLMLCFWFE